MSYFNTLIKQWVFSASHKSSARISLACLPGEVIALGDVKAPKFLQVQFPEIDGVYRCRNPKTSSRWYLGMTGEKHNTPYYIGKNEDHVRAATKVHASVLDRPEPELGFIDDVTFYPSTTT